MSDLNIIVYDGGKATPEHDVLSCMKKAFKLGYNTLALNVIIGDAELSSRTAIPSPIKFDIPEYCLKEARSQNRTLRVLTRLSGKISDNQQAHKLQQNAVSSEYDILAAHPATDGILNSIVSHGGVDIFYFPLSEHYVFPKYSSISFAIQKGILIELTYSSLIGTKKPHILKNMRRLIHREKKGFFFSSGVSSPEHLRGPLDVSFLGHLLDYSAEHSRCLVWDSPKSVVVHSETRRRKDRGIVFAQPLKRTRFGDRWLVEACQDVGDEETAD